ncbi:hypothetical protein GOODEAATRI_022075 [Goodea atripinnis]|uniref:Uncharacterized protein n=1 Tax=Goodea atripinnis TaxID=208336 RepID=A0ABV0N4U4_9TELE
MKQQRVLQRGLHLRSASDVAGVSEETQMLQISHMKEVDTLRHSVSSLFDTFVEWEEWQEKVGGAGTDDEGRRRELSGDGPSHRRQKLEAAQQRVAKLETHLPEKEHLIKQ